MIQTPTPEYATLDSSEYYSDTEKQAVTGVFGQLVSVHELVVLPERIRQDIVNKGKSTNSTKGTEEDGAEAGKDWAGGAGCAGEPSEAEGELPWNREICVTSFAVRCYEIQEEVVYFKGSFVGKDSIWDYLPVFEKYILMRKYKRNL